mmetsp:Transcript_64787/g.193059  ORF Transcript_64787/g.193059 Transcript_64787/m.193059 type:complete len:255 (-) Transcript_64787:339-1103(-)
MRSWRPSWQRTQRNAELGVCRPAWTAPPLPPGATGRWSSDSAATRTGTSCAGASARRRRSAGCERRRPAGQRARSPPARRRRRRSRRGRRRGRGARTRTRRCAWYRWTAPARSSNGRRPSGSSTAGPPRGPWVRTTPSPEVPQSWRPSGRPSWRGRRAGPTSATAGSPPGTSGARWHRPPSRPAAAPGRATASSSTRRSMRFTACSRPRRLTRSLRMLFPFSGGLPGRVTSWRASRTRPSPTETTSCPPWASPP